MNWASELYAAFESKAILSESHVAKLESLHERDILTLYETVFRLIFEERQRHLNSQNSEVSGRDPFTFFAGASLRADSGCSDPDCRARKIDFLGRYAALYANEVTMPVSLVAPNKLQGVTEARRRLSQSAGPLLQLRPVIDRGIIHPVVMVTRHCPHTIEWVKQMTDLVYYVATDASAKTASEFKAVYQRQDKSPTGEPTVYFTGPQDFLEHGDLRIVYKKVPAWVGTRWKYNRKGERALSRAQTLGFVRSIFQTISEDTTFYLAYGLLHRARLLTNLPGEAFFLDWLTEDERITANASAMRSLTHAVPILGELSLATLVRIRQEERDAFEAYRIAITKIAAEVLTDGQKFSEEQARDMLREIIEPQLVRLRTEVRLERQRQINRVVGGAAALVAGIAMGMFGGFPGLVRDALAGASAVTGGGLLRKAAEAACEHGANLRQENDLYFLTRLERETHS